LILVDALIKRASETSLVFDDLRNKGRGGILYAYACFLSCLVANESINEETRLQDLFRAKVLKLLPEIVREEESPVVSGVQRQVCILCAARAARAHI
jgi:hypothetical protein